MVGSHSHALKLQRAVDRLKRLQAGAQKWIRVNEKAVTHEPDADRRGYTAFYLDLGPPPDEISTLISECLHHFRSGLDSFAYALAAAHTNPLPDEYAEFSEFPIFGDEDRSEIRGTGTARYHATRRDGSPAPGSGLIKIRGIHPTAQALIEGLQPYQRGNDYRDDPLWRLHELSRTDKHRLLHLVGADFDGVGFISNDQANWTIGAGTIVVLGGPVEGRTHVASLPLRPSDPRRAMHVDAIARLQVAFGGGTPVVAGMDPVDVLIEIYDHIADRVLPPLERFL